MLWVQKGHQRLCPTVPLWRESPSGYCGGGWDVPAPEALKPERINHGFSPRSGRGSGSDTQGRVWEPGYLGALPSFASWKAAECSSAAKCWGSLGQLWLQLPPRSLPSRLSAADGASVLVALGSPGCLCPIPDWKKGMDVPTDIAIAYLLQCSFYGHSIYATAYMDTWRKDSVVMLLHHVVTLTLIALSYAFR